MAAEDGAWVSESDQTAQNPLASRVRIGFTTYGRLPTKSLANS